ncbi:hypothetical protein K4F52_004357 [Lecanicillium sp. MT-2017a]|nr:hypothetical protein K4F52_004357 [Lecanicillium sp. MT-2017a]
MSSRRSSYPFSPATAVSPSENLLPAQQAAATSRDAPPVSPGAQPELSASQLQLNEYREKLARDLERRELQARGLICSPAHDKIRVSPIQEESASLSPWASSNLNTSSTDSGGTIRGGMTPSIVAGTPSYPFPRMAKTPGAFPGYHGHPHGPHGFPYAHSSPKSGSRMSITLPAEPRATFDRALSENSTPASTFTFNPGGTPHPETFDYPNPDLYNLSLQLASEPGLEAWWDTVIQIMKDVYLAERVTLSVPADASDIENVPWGQKATYNEHQEDELSLGYMAKGSSAVQSSEHDGSDHISYLDDIAQPDFATRPGLQSRHSFTSFEENARKKDATPAIVRRPSHLYRSKTSAHTPLQDVPPSKTPLERTKLEELEAEMDDERNIPSWELPFLARYDGQGRVHAVLQALEFEADPLIDHSGVMRVLERNKPVTLTRSYPYLPRTEADDEVLDHAASDAARKAKKQRADSSSKLSSILPSPSLSRASSKSKIHGSDGPKDVAVSAHDDEHRPYSPRYEEYEQAPPSPWSQSPAPSPAVRPDHSENPFFSDAMVDEDSFNPASENANYVGMPPPEAIGLDNSWTVLHIPLTHVIHSRHTKPFKLDATNMEQKMQNQAHDEKPSRRATDSTKKDSTAPIAILSILSPITPYPANLRHSLEHLAPHLATSFSLSRHYTNLETELAGMQRRRPPTTGFGAVAPYGRSIESAVALSSADMTQLRSSAGSITSPSDYSGVSKSATGSPLGTPGWEQLHRRQPLVSPAAISQGGGSYFSSKPSSSVRHDALSPGAPWPKLTSKDSSPGDKRSSRLAAGKAPHEASDGDEHADWHSRTSDDSGAALSRSLHSSGGLRETPIFEIGADQGKAPEGADKSKNEEDPTHHRHHSDHTLLHSYGADFASTFQSLPPSSVLTSRPPPTPLTSGPSRSVSMVSSAVDMPPPSDRLKSLILDSLPAHVFVSLPQTGEIVWVNSRYLSYRGQTVNGLAADPWKSLHPDDRDEYLKRWGHSLRTGDSFSTTVRIRRFDGAYRWFYARAVASKDKRGVIMQFLGSYMDIHDQHIAELKAARQEEIEASEAKHRLLANLIPQIIFTATEDDGVTFANEQWLSYTGQAFEDSLGLGFMDFVHPEDLAKCRIPINRQASEANLQSKKQHSDSQRSVRFGHMSTAGNTTYEMPTADLAELARKGIIRVSTDANGRVSYTTEVRLRSKTDEYRWHLIRCVEIDTIDFGQGASSYFGSATDINDHKLLEAKLKEAMESKGRFLSNMSHEIRTPLIGISGMVSFLQDTVLDDEQRDYTTTIQTSASSLIMIINDILDLSKADAGMMKLNFEWFRTRSIMEDVNELVSTMAISKGLELNYLVDADVPVWVKGDKIRIRQVLLNVVGNAIKFTEKGEVFSHCKVYTGTSLEFGTNEIILEFAVTDTGRGFSQKEAELIFKPFSQIDGSSTRQHGGSGLGLVISRQLVELHGGKLEGTAVLGKGSTFTFSARFALPTAEDQPSVPQSPGSTISALSRQESSDGMIRGSPQLSATSKRNADGPSPGENIPTTLVSRVGGSAAIAPLKPSLAGTLRTSLAGVNAGLARFSEAAKASGHDLSQMRLELPSGRDSPALTTPDTAGRPQSFSPAPAPPPVYTILVICPQHHSREATVQHIEMTLPKDVPHEITAIGTMEDAHNLIGGEDVVSFSHIVINLGSAEAILAFLDEFTTYQAVDKTTIVILSDSVQRQAVLKAAAGTKSEETLASNSVTFIYKPVKPSRFAVIFDPNKVRDLSTDWNRSSAQQMVEKQKASYNELTSRIGNKGYKVLVVEDNRINQKVLTKYLDKIGVDIEIAEDGVECTDMVMSKPHDYYALILCDIQMPHKDGYEACRDIREWEEANSYPKIPVIALSANVMSVVSDKCAAAGFSDYVTKPVDFISLSKAMVKFFT